VKIKTAPVFSGASLHPKHQRYFYMTTFRGFVAGLGFAVCLTLAMGSARAAAQSAPLLSGTYTLKIHRFCQPFFTGQMSGGPTDSDITDIGFVFPGSIKDQIGVVTFNAKNESLSGSMIQIGGSVLYEDLTALGAGTNGTAFGTSFKSLAGTYSTTSSTFTVTSADGTTSFQAVFGVITNKIAHVVLFATAVPEGGGNSCEESGELQYK
jgi:hypothetical protein